MLGCHYGPVRLATGKRSTCARAPVCGVRSHACTTARAAPHADDKAAGFLVDDAAAVVREYGGDLSRLRAVARRDPEQARRGRPARPSGGVALYESRGWGRTWWCT